MNARAASTSPAVAIHGLQFAWGRNPAILDVPELRIETGERVLMFGPSGSGKSTLLGLVAGVLPSRSGQIAVLNHPLQDLSQAARDRFRARHVGIIFQMFNLLPFLSVYDNVALGCQFSSHRRQRLHASGTDIPAEIRRLLGHMGLPDSLLSRKVGELSVGQQQRVAAARALLGSPPLLIADEPTSALDAQSRDQFLELLLAESARSGGTLLFVSHDLGLARHFSRVLALPEINRAADRSGATPP